MSTFQVQGHIQYASYGRAHIEREADGRKEWKDISSPRPVRTDVNTPVKNVSA